MTCILCKQPVRWSWTGTKAVAQCSNCGLPYKLYTVDTGGKVKILEQPIPQTGWLTMFELALFWEETHCRISAQVLKLSTLRDHDVATYADISEWNDWWSDYCSSNDETLLGESELPEVEPDSAYTREQVLRHEVKSGLLDPGAL